MELLKAEKIKKGVFKVETNLIKPTKPDYKYFLQRKGVTEFIIWMFGNTTTTAYSYHYEERDKYFILDTNENFFN